MASQTTDLNASNYHVQYMDVTSQHWNPTSETFAGGDNLLTALSKGWQVEKCTELRHWFAGLRCVSIFRFDLVRDGDTMTMPVINNPYVARLIRQMELEVTVEDVENSRSA